MMYNLDVVIAVGYRVNSYEATQFRIRSTQILKEADTRFNYLKEKMQYERDRLVCADDLDVIMEQTLSNTAVVENAKR